MLNMSLKSRLVHRLAVKKILSKPSQASPLSALHTSCLLETKKKSIYDQGGPKYRGIELLRDPQINKVIVILIFVFVKSLCYTSTGDFVQSQGATVAWCSWPSATRGLHTGRTSPTRARQLSSSHE